ncbi:MAG: DUF3794 domain-containing protein [Firmicutes bacterium]|nr:DUF3794 domain-containing protein [Bacillota bacterium]
MGKMGNIGSIGKIGKAGEGELDMAGEVRSRSAQELEAMLPMRAIAIKEIRATTQNVTYEIIPDKIIVQGNVHKQVFYVGEDNIVHHFPETMKFTAMVEIPGARPGMLAQVRPEIFNIIAELSPTGEELRQKVILDVFVKVTDLVQLNIAEDPYGIWILADMVVGEETVQVLEAQDITMAFPAIKIAEIRATVQDISVDVSPGQVLVTGTIHKQIFYVGTDDANRHQAADLPFTVAVPVAGAQPGMNVQVHPTIRDISFSLDPTGTILFEEVLVDIFVKVTETGQVAMALGSGPFIKTERVIGQATSEIIEETTVTLDRPAIKIRDISASVEDLRARIIEGKVIIQGAIVKNIVYIGEDDLEYTQVARIPFNDFVEIPGAIPGANVFIEPVIRAVIFNPDQTGILLPEKLVADLRVTVTETTQLPVAIDPYGPLLKVQQVIGEGMAQVMAEIVIPRILPIIMEFERIMIPVITRISKQALVESTFALPVEAIKIKNIDASIINLVTTPMTGKVLVQGTVHKQIFFVGADNIVHHQVEDVPFSFIIESSSITPETPVVVNVRIENVIAKLLPGGLQIHQLVIIEGVIEHTEFQVFQVVVKVEGPGVTATTVRVRALVDRGGVPTPAEFNVVTDVTGPRVRSVSRITLELDVVDDGIPHPVPVSVVTDVSFNY